jgi:hypothetical protein
LRKPIAPHKPFRGLFYCPNFGRNEKPPSQKRRLSGLVQADCANTRYWGSSQTPIVARIKRFDGVRGVDSDSQGVALGVQQQSEDK